MRWNTLSILFIFLTISFSIIFFSAILQQTTVGIGQIKFQGIATCLFLCMDACGTIYGAVNIFFKKTIYTKKY